MTTPTPSDVEALIAEAAAMEEALGYMGEPLSAARIHRMIEALRALAALRAQEPEWPTYCEHGMGCGIEDRDITNRYEACRYGFDEAVQQCGIAFSNWLRASPVVPPAAANAVPDGYKEQFSALKKHERHRNNAETRYWCEQYRQFIERLLSAAPGNPAAQATKEHLSITLNLREVTDLIGWFGGEDADIAIQYFDESKGEDGEIMPAGYWCWFIDYPEEGRLPLGLYADNETDTTRSPKDHEGG